MWHMRQTANATARNRLSGDPISQPNRDRLLSVEIGLSLHQVANLIVRSAGALGICGDQFSLELGQLLSVPRLLRAGLVTAANSRMVDHVIGIRRHLDLIESHRDK